MMVTSSVAWVKSGIPTKGGPCCRKRTGEDDDLSCYDGILEETRGKHWESASLAEIVGHTVRKTDVLIIPEIERLDSLLSEVCSGHAVSHPELLRAYTLFYWLKRDLMNHILNESDSLLPYIVRLERAINNNEDLPKPFFHSVRQSVRLMMVEHDAIEDLVRSLATATSNFEPPHKTCAAFRRLYSGLALLSASLRELTRLENYVIFPRAVELECRQNERSRGVQ
ncbi:MAG TPA: hypothetical protein VFV34_23135 [Blastocatellia bacterium]|nr:hypothetical protein [Blastocatellia bacterium]